MEKETFGVELELVTSKFSQKMEEMKSRIASFGKIAKQNFQTGLYMDVSQSKNDLQSLQNELKQLQSSNYEWTPMDNGELINARDRIAQLKIQINDLKTDINTIETSKISKLGQIFGAIKTPIDKVKNSIKQSKNGMSEFSTSVNKSFKNGISSIKRFALSLFGIQSMWRAVSRASSSYLSQDIELSNKLQAVWVGLGSMLAPILNNLANFFLKLVGYFNVFIKSLTGVDLLANAMAKANDNTKKTTKSTKELKGQLSGFDEINNIADNESEGNSSTPDTSWTDAFNGIELDTSWTETITNFGIWMQENWEIVIGLISGTAIALGLIKFGVDGIMALGIGAILAGIIITIGSIIDFIKDPSWDNFANILFGLSIILAGVAIAMLAVNAANPVAWIMLAIAAVVAFAAIIIKNWDAIIGAIKKGAKAIGDFFVNLWNGIKNVFSTVGKWFGKVFGDAFNGVKNVVTNIWNGILKLFSKGGQIFSGVVDGIANVFKTIVNFLITGINKVVSIPFKTINGLLNFIRNAEILGIAPFKGLWSQNPLPVPQIPKLDTGTNFVPNDQLAYIHKGEAVVPKKFNSEEYFRSDNEETNELLRELISTIEDKDTNTYLDGKEIGKVARKYIVNQNRIMGRSVA